MTNKIETIIKILEAKTAENDNAANRYEADGNIAAAERIDANSAALVWVTALLKDESVFNAFAKMYNVN